MNRANAKNMFCYTHLTETQDFVVVYRNEEDKEIRTCARLKVFKIVFKYKKEKAFK